jgi:tetratricopeptide (TPR) repeat protein
VAHGDLVAARTTFRRLRAVAPEDVDGLLGLGEVHLKLGEVYLAETYALAARERFPTSSRAAALRTRALLRARRFDYAAEVSGEAVEALPEASPELLAAHASALFRIQRTGESARAYRRVLELDSRSAEAHLRLGSGLLEPAPGGTPGGLEESVIALRAGDLEGAVARLEEVVGAHGDHPTAHRLLGEALLRRDAGGSLAATSREFRQLREAIPVPYIAARVIEEFMPSYAVLSEPRRRVVVRALALFERYLPRLVAMGGRHDLLFELERTTEARARAGLQGKRTFDGRYWDDVRGIGGLRAATGIEALDDASRFGFDTLTHEITHQAHLYGFERTKRRRVRELYRAARAEDRFLDYYAANNEAEYFGQGVEAFASFGKRPGRETTHGHTRFELYRVDRDLHDFIAGVVDYDPLRDPRTRRRILPAAVEVALRSGRPRDAVVAAEMMDDDEEKFRLLARARRALTFSLSY